MEFLINYWYIIVAIFALVLAAIVAILKFFALPTDKQKANVREWLIWACIEAEKALQSGTGQLKLREVYNKFVSIPAFNWMAKIVTFETFSTWVDTALVTAKEMIIENTELATYVYGDNAESEVAKLKSQLGN